MEKNIFLILKKNDHLLCFPKEINVDIQRINNSIKNKTLKKQFLFIGDKGTGKTDAVKLIASDLDRKVYSINFQFLNAKTFFGKISKLKSLFKKINSINDPSKMIILFDDISRMLFSTKEHKKNIKVLNKFIGLLKNMDSDIVLFVTANLINILNDEFLNYFAGYVDFNKYSIDDLIFMASKLIENKIGEAYYLKNRALLEKIITMFFPVPTPKELEKIINIPFPIKDDKIEDDILRMLYCHIKQYNGDEEVKYLYQNWFTVEEIEILTGIPKTEIQKIIKR